jgi:hypothetical protein
MYKDVNEFEKVYQLIHLMKDENDLLEDLHNILNSWKKYVSQLFIVHRVSDVRQIEMHRGEP